MRRAALGTPVLVAAAMTLSACTTLAADETCMDWVLYDTPAAAAEEATVVVRATVAQSVGTAPLWGVRANVWRLNVAEVLSGSMRGVAAGEELTVVSAPRTCDAGGTYPGGDPLDTGDEVVVLVHDDEMFDVVRTITPYDGVVPPGPDGGLPAAWPVGQHDL